MKTRKSILLLAVMFLLGISVNAQQNQRIAYVDSDYILENIPEYTDAQEEINQLSKKWEKEITALFQAAQELDREYQAESVLLSEDQKRKKKEAITAKRQEAENLRMQYYGPEGELFAKRAELIQPIQEKVYNAINQVALTKNYAFVFDKAAGTSMLYCSDKNDISDEILDEIGNVMQTVRREDRKKNN
ncbi:MAG: OmpH family outer membrane protein [Bacteroidales bacterium]|jgi:outer membrane protein|nr:OmpH family outer membrane protein [Bacteroidales bacterium]